MVGDRDAETVGAESVERGSKDSTEPKTVETEMTERDSTGSAKQPQNDSSTEPDDRVEPAETEPVTITLVEEDGASHTVRASLEDSILEVTDRKGIELRHGCRKGRCVSCTGLLLEGEVEYDVEPQALSTEQRAEGFTLLCIARPVDDCLIEVGRSVLAQAFPQLWQTESHPDLDALQHARRQLRRVKSADVDSIRPAHLGGALAPFDNLHEIYEAYQRALETTESHGHRRK